MKDRGQKTGTQFLAGLAIGLCYVWLIVDARAASAASVSALGLCAKVIVPSLFPFFVCSNLFCALGLERPMERVLSRVVEPLFGVPGSGAAALFVGLTGGYPSGAQSVGALYGGGSIDRKTAKRLLLFCNNCGPAFIFGVVGPAVFGGGLAGLLLYLVHVASSLLLGIFARKSGHMQERTAQDAENVPSVSFSSALTASVKKSGQTALEVCMFVVVFGVVTAMVQTALRPVLPDWALVIVSGLLELSGGASALAEAAMPQGKVCPSLLFSCLRRPQRSRADEGRAVLRRTGESPGLFSEASACAAGEHSEHSGLCAVPSAIGSRAGVFVSSSRSAVCCDGAYALRRDLSCFPKNGG